MNNIKVQEKSKITEKDCGVLKKTSLNKELYIVRDKVNSLLNFWNFWIWVYQMLEILSYMYSGIKVQFSHIFKILKIMHILYLFPFHILRNDFMNKTPIVIKKYHWEENSSTKLHDVLEIKKSHPLANDNPPAFFFFFISDIKLQAMMGNWS